MATESRMESDLSCSECGTRDTPLWRIGPKGPKSMCNACGIRWKRKNGSLKKKKKKDTLNVNASVKQPKKKVRVPREIPEQNNLTLAINEEYIQLSRKLLPSTESSGFPRSSLHFTDDNRVDEDQSEATSGIPSSSSYDSLKDLDSGSSPKEPNYSDDGVEDLQSDPEDEEYSEDRIRKEAKRKMEIYELDTTKPKKRAMMTNRKVQEEQQVRFFEEASFELERMLEQLRHDKEVNSLKHQVIALQDEVRKKSMAIDALQRAICQGNFYPPPRSYPYIPPPHASAILPPPLSFPPIV